MIKLKSLVQEMLSDIPIQHVQQGDVQNISNNFTNYIKHVENEGRMGFNKSTKLWYPYKDVAGWHIGYGHKIEDVNELESVKKGVSEEYINKLLNYDLMKAQKVVNNYIKKTYKINLVLTTKQNEMLMDFAYNLGSLDKFPKFVHAVLNDNVSEMRREYKRHVNGKELIGRNKAFYNEFLK